MLVSARKNKQFFGVGSGRTWSAKEHLNSECGLRNRYVLPCIVRVFNGVQRFEPRDRTGERAANHRTPLPGVVRAVNPSGPNFYAGFVRVRPVSKASELVRRPVKGEETGHRREEADRSTSPIIFFSKNEDFRPNADLLYRFVIAYASENFRKRLTTRPDG